MGADGTTYEGFKQSGDAAPRKAKSAEEIGFEAGRATRKAADEALRVWRQEFAEPFQEMGEDMKYRGKVRARWARQKARIKSRELRTRLSESARKAKEIARPIVTGEKTQEFTETLTPASLPLILRAIDKRFIEVYDTHHGKPAYFLKLEQALDEMYYAYADAGDAPSLGASGSRLLAKTAMFLESADMDDPEKAKRYQEASAKALREVVGKRIQDEMRRDLMGYLVGREHTQNSGETVRSEPDYRMLSNMLVFLEHWNKRQEEVTDRATDPLLSEPRIQELFRDMMRHIRDEIILIHSMLEVESEQSEGAALPPPIDEHEERLRAASPLGKWGRIFELQRIEDELSRLSPETATEHGRKIPVSDSGVSYAILKDVIGSFDIDTHFGARASATFDRHFERNPNNEVVITKDLHSVITSGRFDALEHLPVKELVSYCNEMAKSGMLEAVTEGEYRDERGRKQSYAFSESVRMRIRAFLKACGGQATGEVTKKFSPEARRVLGIDRMLFEIRDEVPLDSATPDGFIPYADGLLSRIPQESPERAKFLKQHLPVLKEIFLGLWEIGGVKDIVDFGEKLIQHDIVGRDQLPGMVFGKNGFLPQFGKEFGKRIISTAALDMGSALAELNVARASGFSEFISSDLLRNLRRTLRTKLLIALSERGSADTRSFLDALKPNLTGPHGIISEETFEALREDVLYDDPVWLERRLP